MRSVRTVLCVFILATAPCGGCSGSGNGGNAADDTRGTRWTTLDASDSAASQDRSSDPDGTDDLLAEAGPVSPDAGDWSAGDAPVPDAQATPDGPPDEQVEPIDTTVPDAQGCEPFVATFTAAWGLVYQDMDQSSDSFYDQSMSALKDLVASGVPVHLLAAGGKEASTLTDACGRFAFAVLSGKSYVVDVDLPEGAICTSANCPHRFPDAVRYGKVNFVTIGDSLATHGGSPKFPDLLPGLMEGLVNVESINAAVPGSRAEDWVPGKQLFETKLDPLLDDADVVVITLGGNDIMAYIGPALSQPGSLLAKLETLDDFQEEIKADVSSIIAEIWKRAPGVDIVFCLIFNYAKSSYWKSYFGSYSGLIQSLAVNAMENARKTLSAIDGLVVADMAGALGEADLSPMLADSVHLSSLGHEFYARQIFLSLGGVHTGPEPLGLERLIGFFPAQE